MKNFLVEIAIAKLGHDSTNDVPVIQGIATNSVLTFTDYVVKATEYFSSMVKFDQEVEHVTMLVRTYRDHHVISITKNDEGSIRVRTNQ